MRILSEKRRLFLLVLTFTFSSDGLKTKLRKHVRRKSEVTSTESDKVTEKSRGGSRVTDEYNTTLTFGEMVAIYHDIWNTMLIGGENDATTKKIKDEVNRSGEFVPKKS